MRASSSRSVSGCGGRSGGACSTSSSGRTGSRGQSLVANAADVSIAYADRPTGVSVVVPVVIGAAGLTLAVIRYRRAEID